MTTDHDGSSIDLERQLVRYMAERRISRRQLLERMAAMGATVALAPVIAACTSSATAAPSSAAPTQGPTAPPASTGASASATPVATEEAPATPVPTPEKELFVYNWAEYLGPDIPKQFEKKYKGRTAVERVNARMKIFWGVDDGNVTGSRRFHAYVGVVMMVCVGFATLLALTPRREGSMGDTRLSPIALALRT